ncbi:MAG: hypothetical protein HY744_23180 [Deltaproteobacteria bacterium]|nr:hypothetical protein [Deltaproteobacteria bacterium]
MQYCAGSQGSLHLPRTLAVASLGALGALLLASCGGKAVLDETAPGGSPAEPCTAPPPPAGSLQTCHGAVAVGEPDYVCANACLDEDDNTYLSECQGASCRCWYDDALLCTCSRDASPGSCAAPTCCPPPWQ